MKKAKEIQESESQCVTLPDDIIFEHMMPKLPVKSLTRFKCVSKSWLSKICSPQFAKTHYHSFPSPSPQFLIFSGNHSAPQHPLLTSITFNEHGHIQETVNLGFTHSSGPIHVVGGCHGLVCFFDQHFNFTICNPVTRQCTSIPVISSPNFDPTTMMAARFGYVSSIDDYKIVCLSRTSDDFLHAVDTYMVGVFVFSLRTKQWREPAGVGTPLNGVPIVRADVPAALMDDTFYMFSANSNIVFGVNLVNGEFSVIPISFPCDDGAKIFRTNDGRLSVCCHRQAWVLNEDRRSWTKMYDLNHEDQRLMCVCETTGKWLVLNRGEVALLDPTASFTGQYQGGTAFDGPILNAWDFKMSLLPPVLE